MKRFNKLSTILSQNLKGFNIKVKEESTLMKIISYILFFNKSFMTGFRICLHEVRNKKLQGNGRGQHLVQQGLAVLQKLCPYRQVSLLPGGEWATVILTL